MILKRRVAGHFGEWMQGQLGRGGPVALITLPCAATGVRAFHRKGGRALRLSGTGLSVPVARRFIASLGGDLTGRVRICALMAPGLGTGVSTARLVALARLAGWEGPPEVLARACIAAEGASDPLMFPAPERLLFASRLGVVLDHLPTMPRFEVIGGFRGRPLRTDPEDNQFPDILDLVGEWTRARSLPDFATLAAESARRCVAMRGPADDPTDGVAKSLGAMGWVMAHTGAARGLIFAPGTVPPHARAALRAAGFRGIVQFSGGAR